MKQRLFIISWAVITLALIVYTIIASENQRRVVGITEVEETTISFPFPVEVRSVSVVPNQQINEGDPLLELGSEELEREILKLKTDIAESKRQLEESREVYKTEIEKLRRERILEVNKLQSELEDVRIALANDIAISGSLNLQVQDSIKNPKEIRLRNLQKEIELTESYYGQLVNVEQIDFESEQAKYKGEIELKEQQLGFSIQTLEELNVVALYDGYVKNVKVEKRTLMEAFTPLITYSKLTPVYVRAYTDEDTRLIVNTGSSVTVSSASRKWIHTEGIIIAESKRITELPDRLKIQPYSEEWGQEFLIQLPADNEFMIGEKVLIK